MSKIIFTDADLEVRKGRYNTLLALFREKHGKDPDELYAQYLLNLLTDLRKVYDENQSEIRRLNKGTYPGHKVKMQVLVRREHVLYKMSCTLREALNLNIVCPSSKKEVRLDPKTQRNYVRKSRTPEPLHQPSEPS